MYLTSFRFNTARTGARRLLASPQALHAAVMSSYPDILPGDDGPRVLWRVDRNARAEVLLYVVGPDEPDLTHLVEQAGWPAKEGGWRTHDYAPFLSRLAKGDVWAFRLTANPVHSIRRRDGEPTKLTPHITPRHQARWLLQRQEAAGFRVLERPGEDDHAPEEDGHDLLVHGRRDLRFGKGGAGRAAGAKPVSLVTVTYDGHLEVTDPDALRRTLTMGLGRARAYGCGLMTLAPAGKR
ncbi:type I-E CRISPR-associated protein Cas6/Cse3/CasE [Marinactinospora thermotolerans]|uniref:CRISPR-associated protein, Cse3 family n=1 Tax=Marinactinospora thermotolerans DSM 45154 TaxID=1122192 RepID=A0A1T4QGD7_9ACTN|nr:type I-E CRISPR-associated protein Cas6/Cse3/CasE [Marinactinospora thermotolerans]SKA02338.1 CRISPR-associated protein, Cse3 family [Marinactinospora thermotolerans DSM 45154]